MGIRQNIFISIMIHTMVIASVFIIGGRISDTSERIPASYLIVSLFKQTTGITSLSSQSTRKYEDKIPLPPLRGGRGGEGMYKNEIASPSAYNDTPTHHSLLNTTSENSKGDTTISVNQHGGTSGELASSQNTGKCQPEDKILESTKGGYHKGDTSPLYGLIRTAIEKAKSYPLLARKKKIEGTVLVSFTINKDGLPQGIQIIKSSGYQILDEEVSKILRKAAPFPEVNHEIIAPITFKLKESISNR